MKTLTDFEKIIIGAAIGISAIGVVKIIEVHEQNKRLHSPAPVLTQEQKRNETKARKDREEMDEAIEAACGNAPSNNYPNDSDIPIWHMMYVEEHKAQTEYQHCAANASRLETFSATPVDLSAAQLAPNYLGNNPEILYRLLVKLEGKQKKGEFEKTDAYRSRLREERAIPIMGKLGWDSMYALQVPRGAVGMIVEYDADKELLDLELTTTRVYSTPGLSSGSLFLMGADHKTYEAAVHGTSNVFDAKTIVHTNPKAAENLNNSVRALLIGKLEAPYISSRTLEDTKSFYLHLRVHEVWFYDFGTGKVVAKVRHIIS